MRGNHRKVTRRQAKPAGVIKRRIAVAGVIGAGLVTTGLGSATLASATFAPATPMAVTVAGHVTQAPALSRRQIMAACKLGGGMEIDGRNYVCVQDLPYRARQEHCARWQAGLLAIIMGPRAPFVAQCVPDGPVFVWDMWR
jgi:hypothetical protein